jgi:polyferredoxin
MHWYNFWGLVFGGMLASAATRLYDDWKAGRKEIPAYRDWRGRWVTDLHLIRLKRLYYFLWLGVLPVIGYLWITSLPG